VHERPEIARGSSIKMRLAAVDRALLVHHITGESRFYLWRLDS
jgi:hypothetical protein